MARYRATVPMFINGARIRVGQEFSFAGPPNKDMEPLDAEATKLMAPLLVGKQPAPAAPVKAEPAPAADETPVGLEAMSDEALRAFIETKGGKQPKKDASRAVILAAATACAGDGVA
jgi:hypothetical protein